MRRLTVRHKIEERNLLGRMQRPRLPFQILLSPPIGVTRKPCYWRTALSKNKAGMLTKGQRAWPDDGFLPEGAIEASISIRGLTQCTK